ncbi:MAG: fibro-slime domain-containing protein [Waterburya sp.]
MLKLINLKKLTSKTLIGILVAGSLITQSGTKEAIAGQCSNNGHGNNGDITFTLANGTKILLTKFDPSNPGNGNKITRELQDSNPGITPNEIASAISIIRSSNFDFERKPTSDVDADCDNIFDLDEAGSNVNSPVDTDNDRTPNFTDTDSDNDGVLDRVEGTGDRDNDGILNYMDATNNLPPATTGTGSSGTGSSGTGSSGSGSTTSNAPASITLTGTIRDFKAKNQTGGHPDFERSPGDKNSRNQSFGYGEDKNITTNTLGSDNKPVYANGSYSTTTKENFDQWYRNVSGVNQSKEYPITLTRQADGTYKYQNNDFFPINGQLFGNYSNNKNFHFTYELHTQFTYKGGETFIFSGDDDVWVYINGKKVIDLGGVHGSQTQNVNLDSLGLTAGQTYDLDFFFAERHTTQSNFTITTNIALEPAPSPDGDEDNDGITNLLEGYDDETDTDGDGTPDYKDKDSDKNGVLDEFEVGDDPASPTDSDSDNIANFMDEDDDGNGRLDVIEIGSNPQSPTNTDGKDLPNYQDLDDDNDKIIDRNELGSNPQSPIDTNQDKTPDYHDTDSDGDTLPDSEEGTSSCDSDGIFNFQDTDSDNDGISDKSETIADSNGDGQSDVNSDNLTSPKTLDDVDGDGIKNRCDRDSDGDSIPDGLGDEGDEGDEGYTYKPPTD